jgi:hypothetical protein
MAKYCLYVRFDGVEGDTEDEAVEVLRSALEAQPFDWFLDDVEVDADGD